MFWQAFGFVLSCFLSINYLTAACFHFDALVETVLSECNIPGAAIGVVVDGQTVWLKGYGFRDVKRKLPVNEHTVFGVGSCTKAFTALLLSQLVEEKKIQWDDPVCRYIPNLQLKDGERTQMVTIRDLIAHRTGIPRYDVIWYCNAMTRQQLLDLLPYLEPVAPLREKFHYNNIMYSLGGMVVESLRGASWEEVIHDYLLTPLKMEDATVSVKESIQGDNYSLPYAEVNGKLRELAFLDTHPVAPGGGLNASLCDMLQWVKLQLAKGSWEGQPLISPESFAEMATPHMAIEDDDFSSYGLGWFLGNFKGHPSMCHAGLVSGFRSEVFLLPDQKIGIAILTNSSSDGKWAITALRHLILDELLDHKAEDRMLSMRQSREESLKNREISPVEHEILPDYPLEYYVGTFRHPAYGTVEIEREGNHLKAHYGRSSFSLFYQEKGYFTGYVPDLLIFGERRFVDATFNLSKRKKGAEVHLLLEPDAPPLTFKKV